MEFTSHDIAIIEQALQLAIGSISKDSRADHFIEVLMKLQTRAAIPVQGTYLQTVSNNGILLDYDDSSVLL